LEGPRTIFKLTLRNAGPREMGAQVVLIIRRLVTFVQLKRAALRLFLSSTSSLLIGLVAQAAAFIVLSRYLGPVQFGQLMTIMAVTNLAGAWTGLGHAEVLRRQVSRDRSLYPDVLGHCLITIFATGILISAAVIVGVLLFFPLVGNRLEDLQILLLIVPSNVILVACVAQAENIFLAHGDFTSANYINGGFGIMRAATAIMACVLFGAVNLRTFASWWAAAHLLACLACTMAVWRFGAPRWRLMRSELWLGSNLALSGFLIMLRHNIDILVLNAVATPQYVGAYGVGRRIIGAALIIPGSFDRIIYGKLAVAGKGGPAATLRLAKRYLVYAMVIGGTTSVSLFVVAPFMPLIFGAGFGDATGVVKILCWTVISTVFQFVAFDALNGAEQHKVSAIVSGSANIAGAAMVVGFGGLYGATGIFAALYLSDAIRGVGLWLALDRLSRRQKNALACAGAGD
jgi:O-antigen/teichoic acid export membrane protein